MSTQPNPFVYEDSVPSDGTSTRRKSTALTREEREVLILSARREGGRHLTNNEIGERLGMTGNRVKTIQHQVCVKLVADNRIEAVLLALRRGEIRATEFMSLEEIASIYYSSDPDIMKRIELLAGQLLEPGFLPGKDEQITHTATRQDAALTNRERDVLILVGRGLTNIEIADALCMSAGTVRNFLCRACAKLGAHRRADAVRMALLRREISIGEIHSRDDLLQLHASSEPESLVAHLASQIASKARPSQVLV